MSSVFFWNKSFATIYDLGYHDTNVNYGGLLL